MSSTSTKTGRGGRREGSGRPPGRNAYGEATQPKRIPVSLVPTGEDLLEQYRNRRDDLPPGEGVYRPVFDETPVSLPLYASRISAGWPSPADDYIEDMLDLQRLLVQHPAATFYLRVKGDSMSGASILDGDILVVDRSVDPVHGRIVVASIDNELTVKLLYNHDNRVALIPENPAYQPIEITDETDLRLWGVVAGIVRKL